MASLINAHDWTTHPLGAISTWPQTLRSFVSSMLASRFPMYLAWGNEGYSFYNDGYIPILTDKHPGAIGATFERVWGELSHEIRTLIYMTRGDRTSYFEDLPLTLLKNGKPEQCYFTFSYSGVRGDSGEIEGFYAVCLETTEAFRAKQVRATENERLRALFLQAPGFMAILRGPTHIFDIANDAYHALVGKSREIIGRTVLEALPEAYDQGFIGLLDQVYHTGKPFVGKETPFVLVREPGEPPTEMYIDFVYQPICNEQSKVIGIMAQGHEVTEGYFARHALLAADRQKDQFIATLAHELRNPLAPIRAASYLLRLSNITPERLEQTSGVISRQVEHMAKLLDDLLDVARISRNQIRLTRERISVDAIVTAAIETARPIIEKKNQKILLRQDGLIQLEGDLVRLTQVLTNLVCNAAKYTEDGGEITVSATREGDQCQIIVKDNGLGICSESLTSVFDMFSQEKDVIDRSEGGLGIGLGLVKGLVELHGGRVSAESKGRGEGSTFTVTLPCLQQSAPLEPPRFAKAAVPSTGSLKVLVADDNVDLVNVLTDFLELLGHSVITAGKGSDALVLVGKELPDVAILDIGMPEMNGYELARAIRDAEWGQKIALIAITGWGNIDDQAKTKAAGFDLHITKPFAIEELQSALHQVAERRGV